MQVFYPARLSVYVFVGKGFTERPGSHGMQEVEGSNPLGSISQAFAIKRFVGNHFNVIRPQGVFNMLPQLL